jgi:hypothetical protein
MCLADPEGFRVQVLAAKRRLATPAGGAALPPPSGVDKAAAGALDAVANPLRGPPPLATGAGGASDGAAVLAVLQRIEQALNEGLRELRRTHTAPAGYPQVPATYGYAGDTRPGQ